MTDTLYHVYFLLSTLFLKGGKNLSKYAENFNEIIKNLRKEKNLTQRELSKKTGISLSMITKYEQGLNTPSIENLRILADFFKKPISDFMQQPKMDNPLEIFSTDEKYIDIENYDFSENDEKFKNIANGEEYIYHILKFLECVGFEIYIDEKEKIFFFRSEDPQYAVNSFLSISNFQFHVQFLRNILIDYSYLYLKEFSKGGKFYYSNNQE